MNNAIIGTREFPAIWVDSNKDLWLLGGNIYNISGYFDDLWKIDVHINSTVTWTWIEGSRIKNQKSLEPPEGNFTVFSFFNKIIKRWI